MAPANPYVTAATAAFLRRDSGDVGERLLTERVGLAFDAEAAETVEGRVALDLALRLLVRLWPRLALVDLSGRHHDLAEDLTALARSVNPDVSLRYPPGEVTRTLVVGETALVGHWPAFYIGSRGWVARFSRDGPVGSGPSTNPFGAAVAACLGVANLFRTAFEPPTDGSVVSNADEPIDLSTFNYTLGTVATDPPLHGANLGETHLVGLGAIGSAAAWTLARVPDLTGTIHLVDNRAIDLANIHRNVLATPGDVGVARVGVAAAALMGARLDVQAHAETWAEYLASRSDWHLPRVAVALGSSHDRVSIQAALPRVVLNAWTQTDDLGVSRHPDFLRAPCLACLYGPKSAGRGESEVIAEAIGLPEAEPEIRDLLDRELPLDRSFLGRIAEARGLDVAPLLPFEGQDLRAFYASAVRGGLFLELGAEGGADVHAPMVFQSALAGVLLAAEMVVDAALPRPALPSTTRIDLRRPLAERLLVPAPRDPYGRCFCGDADYRGVYARKYAA